MEDRDRDVARIIQYIKDNIKPGKYLYFARRALKLADMPPDEARQKFQSLLQVCRLEVVK